MEKTHESKYRIRISRMSPCCLGGLPAPCWTLMISRTDVVTKAGIGGLSTPGLAVSRLGFISLLVLSAWCGLVCRLA